ncbi:hypothetical protein NTH44_003181 [Vibrio metoecus]
MLNNEEKIRYSNALKGLKAQANAVVNALPNNPNKVDLANAQSLMSDHDFECRVIYRLVMRKGVPVPELDEAVLFSWLEE